MRGMILLASLQPETDGKAGSLQGGVSPAAPKVRALTAMLPQWYVGLGMMTLS
jgi:hypothetical protein